MIMLIQFPLTTLIALVPFNFRLLELAPILTYLFGINSKSDTFYV